MCVSPPASKVAKGSLNPHSCHRASHICDDGKSQSGYVGPLPVRGQAAVLPGAPLRSRGEFCGHHMGKVRTSAPWENNPPPWEVMEHSRTGSSYPQAHGAAQSFQTHTLPAPSHRLPTSQAPTPSWRSLSPVNLLFLLGLVSSHVSSSCTFPQLFPPSLISGSFLSLFFHLSFHFVFRENARRNVLTWPTGTECRLSPAPDLAHPLWGHGPGQQTWEEECQP